MEINLLNSSFWGAKIGAAGSIAGGYFASRYQIKRQLSAEKERNMKKVKESASIVYGDIITLVKAMLFYRNKGSIVGFYLDYTQDYSAHVDLLSDHIGGDNTYFIRKIYGHLVHLQSVIILPELNSTKLALLASPNYEAFCKVFYGSTEKFALQTNHTGDTITEANYSHLFIGMEPRMKSLLDLLNKIKS